MSSFDEAFAQDICAWGARNGRKGLPWQVTGDFSGGLYSNLPSNLPSHLPSLPESNASSLEQTECTPDQAAYLVWVSEIMLQQTQVTTVMRYYQAFINIFPTVQALAAASMDDVLKQWAGLGYYRRARNLKLGADMVDERWQGKFPTTLDQLQEIPGIGRSTAGAMMALAWNLPGVILDANVARVIQRAILGVWKEPVRAATWKLAEQLSSKAEPRLYQQSMMDLGSMVCKNHHPDCASCPLADSCKLNNSGEDLAVLAKQELFKQKAKKKPISVELVNWALLVCKQSLSICLVQQPIDTGIWRGLWVPIDHETIASKLNLESSKAKLNYQFTHVLSHKKLEIHAKIYLRDTDQVSDQDADAISNQPIAWVSLENIAEQVAVPKPVADLVTWVLRDLSI